MHRDSSRRCPGSMIKLQSPRESNVAAAFRACLRFSLLAKKNVCNRVINNCSAVESLVCGSLRRCYKRRTT